MGFFCFSRSPTLYAARRVYQSRHEEFKVDVDIKCCIHGYLARDKKEPASLIIFAPQLACVDKGTFNLFKMEINFCDILESSQPCNPVLVSTAPFSVPQRVQEDIVVTREKHTVLVKKTKKLIPSVGVDSAGLKVGLQGELGSETQKGREREQQYNVHYFIQATSGTCVDEKSGRRNGVWWNIKKSNKPGTGDDAGIPPNYLFAVLLTRTNDNTPFEARFRLLAKVGIANKKDRTIEVVSRKVREKLGRQSSVQRLSQEFKRFAIPDCDGAAKPMVFDPKKKLEGDCRGIDRMQLGRYAKAAELARLTTMAAL